MVQLFVAAAVCDATTAGLFAMPVTKKPLKNFSGWLFSFGVALSNLKNHQKDNGYRAGPVLLRGGIAQKKQVCLLYECLQ
jgi:hypothetical protein